MFKPQIGPYVLTVRAELRRAFLLGVAIAVFQCFGCGEVSTVDPGLVDRGPAVDVDAGEQAPDAGAPTHGETAAAADAGAADTYTETGTSVQIDAQGETAAAADAGAEHPALHCGLSTEWRFSDCKPGCGICTRQTSTSTIEGCWTNDTDYHCVHTCGDCR